MRRDDFGSPRWLDRESERRVRELATLPGCVVRLAWWAAVVMGAAWLVVTAARGVGVWS